MEDNDDHHDAVEKLSAVYGEEWKQKSSENLMKSKYFKAIPEFLQSKRKILTCESVKQKLSYYIISIIYIQQNLLSSWLFHMLNF